MFNIMTFEKMDEEQRKFMTYDQEELGVKKKMKSEGAGLLILGIPLLLLGIANQTVLGLLYDEPGSITQLLVTIGAIVLGIVCCIFGVRCMGKTGLSILEGVRRLNKDLYTIEDIYDYYREVREDRDALIFLANKKKVKETDKTDAGLLTRNWIKVPNQRPIIIAKLQDVVAAWHDKDGNTGFGFKGLYILRSDGELFGMDCSKEFSEKVISEIGKRNPMTILTRRFTYEGNTYDVCANKQQVIALYQENLRKQM